ncbi:hypothetical protein GS03_00921 [Flavobacterium sangjuense]|uniref:Uncharacterized protein n=1 Tax=Flavobacterium sangjuense TaxID=2518177 RepID=A0A4P7PTB6_9FLAO|nr:hypothetical protein GS03_00921 [Flavobacterium sangjuense]
MKFKSLVSSSPDCSGNPGIAKDNYDEIASFLAMTDWSGKRVEIPQERNVVILIKKAQLSLSLFLLIMMRLLRSSQ